MNAKRADRIATVVFWAIGLTGLFILLLIVLEIFVRGITTMIKPSFLFGEPNLSGEGGGIWPMIVSTLYLLGLTIVISLPLSLGAAIYLAEFAREGRITNAIRFSLDSLGTLPSIVFGMFGMVVFATYFGWNICLLAGACTLALLNMPVLLRSTEEALRQVPRTYREASMSLGASRWTTVKQVVLPSAMPAIITGTILPIGRILGESAAVIWTVGTFVRFIPTSPFDPAAPMAANIYFTQTESTINNTRQFISGQASLLLVLILLVNFGVRRLAKYYSKKKSLGG
jgi:phosphate transport system permease protein